MSIKVQNCPFCNYDDVEIDEIELGCYAVCCPDCEAIGPVSHQSLEEAIEKWNRKA